MRPINTLSPDDIVIVGCDPGPIPGVCCLRYSPEHVRTAIPIVWQGTPEIVALFIKTILPPDVARIYLAYEPFVTSNRSSHLAQASAASITARQGGALAHLQQDDLRIIIRRHTAAQVKPWASADRLERAGLGYLAKTVGRHGADAIKQALFCASKDAGVPDPLSKRHKKIEVPA